LAVDSNTKETERIAKERAELEKAGQEAQQKFDSEIGELKAQMGPIRKAYEREKDKAGPIQRRIDDLRRDAARREDEARREKDDNRKRDRQRDADRLRGQVRDEERRLDPIQREMARLDRDYRQFEGQAARVLSGFQAFVAAGNRQLVGLRKAELAVEKSQKALEKPPGATPRQSALASKIAALTTYQKFPLEEERQRLMRVLDK
jgi:chromosome segregation ATPase